jgi:dUTP pyrophosphatase
MIAWWRWWYNRPVVLKFKKLHPDAVVPPKSYARDAGIDLCAVEEVTIPARGRASVPTGVALELPSGCVGLVWDKSGLAKNNGITVLAGVIDEGFRGELVLFLANLSDEPQTIKKGQKAAQLLVQKVEHVEIQEADELSPSERGEKGWGSSGVMTL